MHPRQLGGPLVLTSFVVALVLVLGGVSMRLGAPSIAGLGGESLQWLGYAAILLGIAAFLVTYALARVKPWARTAAIALGCASLMFFPHGTIVGIVLLWYLYRPGVDRLFTGQDGMGP